MVRTGAVGDGAGSDGRRHEVEGTGEKDHVASSLVECLDQLPQLGSAVPPLVQRQEQGFFEGYAGASAGELDAADTGYEFDGLGAATNAVEQFLGGNVEVAPHADDAALALLGLRLRVVKHGFLIAVGHGANFGRAGMPGDHVEDGLEADEQVGPLDRLTPLEGKHVGITGADADDGHFDSGV